MYLNYPETPEELKAWRAKIIQLFDDHNKAEKYYADTGKRPTKTVSQPTPA